ncbi:hypothetical protein BpHYR1_046356 [Brachionus plicatilis]|uniref:Uncharacterized protein n=1 Tax=Brachionus plicatilis TaxID=10195 RepID=A0A3M7RG95_BRAPC|nr:hypothetical protein BpHYR1_046356 [Brachionus plicatilis]
MISQEKNRIKTFLSPFPSQLRLGLPFPSPLYLGLPFTSPLCSNSPLKTPLNSEAPCIYLLPLPSPEFFSVPTFVSDYCHRLYLRSVRCHSRSSTSPFTFLRFVDFFLEPSDLNSIIYGSDGSRSSKGTDKGDKRISNGNFEKLHCSNLTICPPVTHIKINTVRSLNISRMNNLRINVIKNVIKMW